MGDVMRAAQDAIGCEQLVKNVRRMPPHVSPGAINR